MEQDEVDAVAQELLAQRDMATQRCVNLAIENAKLKRQLKAAEAAVNAAGQRESSLPPIQPSVKGNGADPPAP